MVLRPTLAIALALVTLAGCRTTEVYNENPQGSVSEKQIANFEGWMSRCQSKAQIVGDVLLTYTIDPVTGLRSPLTARLAPNVDENQKRIFDKCLADDAA